MPGAAPLVLGKQFTITRGQTLRVDSEALAPKVLVPYEVTSIRMAAYPSVNGNVDVGLRGFLKWQFVGAGHPMTDSFIPMWNLSPTRQSVVELGGYYEWRFPYPLVLPPGARIDAQVQLAANTPNAGVTPITVWLAYAGRLRHDIARFPDEIDVPYASCWDSTITGGAVANDPTTLRNPLSKDVDVRSLVARVENDSTGLDGDDSQTLQVFSPDGYAMAFNGPVQFHAAFPRPTHEFPYQGTLPTNNHFAVRLTTPPSVTFRPMISYLGTRKERVL